MDDVIATLPRSRWDELPDTEAGSITAALESGQVLFLPHLRFVLEPDETRFLTPACSDGKAKNVSYDTATGQLRGTSLAGADHAALTAMIARFSQHARQLIETLCPHYVPQLIMGRTSYRPVEVVGRPASVTRDDSRLHVDAFSATPNHGRRILRVFSNINPAGSPRVWEIGEPFETMSAKFYPAIRRPFPGSAWLLEKLHVTRDRRSEYDHIMLQLHDRAKRDDHYQQSAPKLRFEFPPGSTWVVYTDRVMHAALSGQYLLEQTFYLPVAAMQEERLAPLRTLERIAGRRLAPS
jgi:hypothetical protein